VHDERTAAVEHLGELLRADLIDLDDFDSATGSVLAATTAGELALVLAALPSPVRMTPAHRRLDQPLVIESHSGAVKMSSTWQLARETMVSTRSGAVVLDLGAAEFDDMVVDLHVTVSSGAVDIIVPFGVGVQLVAVSGQSSALRNDLGPTMALPGLPLVRLHLTTSSGAVKLRRPRPPRTRRRWFRFWRRR
jgi:hypothetical protein